MAEAELGGVVYMSGGFSFDEGGFLNSLLAYNAGALILFCLPFFFCISFLRSTFFFLFFSL